MLLFGRRIPAIALLVLAAYIFVVLIPAAMRPDTNGFATYYTSARIFVEPGTDMAQVYDDVWFQRRIDGSGFHGVVDMYMSQPPAMALLLTPVCWLSPAAARVVWTGAAAAFWVFAVALLCRAARGRWPKGVELAVAVAATTAYRPLRENFDRGQVYTLLLLFLSASLVLMLRPGRRSEWLSGVPVGVMFAVKSAGAWWLVCFLLTKRWRALAGATLAAAGVVLATIPRVGLSAWVRFVAGVVRLPVDPICSISAYQTVNGLVRHLLVLEPTNPFPLRDAPASARVVVAALTTVVAFVTWRSLTDSSLGRRVLAPSLPPTPNAKAAPSGRLALALADSLVVTLAPLAEGYHYVLVLPAVFLAIHDVATRGATTRSRVVLFTAIVLITAPQAFYSAPALQRGGLALFAYPRVYGALVLWGWLAVRCRHSLSLRPAGVRPTACC